MPEAIKQNQTSYFPHRVHADAGEYAAGYLGQLASAASTLDFSQVARAGEILTAVARRGGMIFSCGNGGSAAIANHLVCDCLKGVRTGTSLRPRVQSLSATVELVTAIVNDIGSEEMFSYQVTSLARPGDVLIAISSSGASPNIVAAIKEAKACGMQTIAMTGFGGGQAAKLADVSLHVDAHNYGIVEDTHQSLMHILAQFMRHSNLDEPDQLSRLKF